MTLEMKFKDIREEGMAQGIAQGITQGSENTLIKLVNDGLISIKDAALQLSISEDDFEKLLREKI